MVRRIVSILFFLILIYCTIYICTISSFISLYEYSVIILIVPFPIGSFILGIFASSVYFLAFYVHKKVFDHVDITIILILSIVNICLIYLTDYVHKIEIYQLDVNCSFFKYFTHYVENATYSADVPNRAGRSVTIYIGSPYKYIWTCLLAAGFVAGHLVNFWIIKPIPKCPKCPVYLKKRKIKKLYFANSKNYFAFKESIEFVDINGLGSARHLFDLDVNFVSKKFSFFRRRFPKKGASVFIWILKQCPECHEDFCNSPGG